MTGDPEEPAGHGRVYPPLESFPGSPHPSFPVDYPASYPPPPPPPYVHRQPPPGYPLAYPGAFPPPYGGYPVDPYDPYQTAAPPGTNAKAIVSLVASLVGLLCCGLPSIAGVVFGVIAMRETKRTGQEGWGIALAGTIIGGTIAAFWLLIVIFWLLGVIVAANSPGYS